MSEFSDAQKALDRARRERKEARSERFAATEKLRKLRRRRDQLTRRLSHDQLAGLERDLEQLSTSVEELTQRERAAVGNLLEQQAIFEPFSDPTENLAQLDDRFPILLFPLRLETRFKRVEVDGTASDQLWIRVYPDDIAVDTFEELLAEVEVRNTRIYWTNVWKAGGDEGAKRAAWRSLVKSHGAGRAFWITQQAVPTNIGEEPVKAPGDHLLVIVTDHPLAAAEKPPVRDYWRAVYRAGNDPAQQEAAFSDLVAALGQGRAETIVAEYAPQNLDAKPLEPESVTNIRVEFLELPPADTLQTQQQPWMNSASTALLPERFVVLGFNGDQQTLLHVGRPVPSELEVGPNPTAPAEAQLRAEDDELVVPEGLEWMTDFDQAVEKGMGFRIQLDATQARSGFDRLFVLGVRLGNDIQASTEQLETLIQHHQRSRKGFSLLPQGAPTNNVEDQTAGYSWRSDADASYDHYFVQDHADDPKDWRHKKDGRWLAESLGIAPAMLKASPNYFATDQCEARALNEALWPATLGYFMEQMMETVFSESAVASTRAYFNRYVVGRGTIPAVRVGQQPYGILPATPYSRMAWLKRELLSGDLVDTGIPNQHAFLKRLDSLIKKADETWRSLSDQVSFVGKPAPDPHQVLLDVVGLHPSSVEFYQRYAESAEQLYNRFKLSGSAGALIAAIIALGYVASGRQLLLDLGHQVPESGELPEILEKFFLQAPNLLKGPLIDDQPLSETEPVRAYHSDGSNYLEWLIAAARESHDALRKQEGFVDDRPPTALLYLMLHHALDLSYVETSIQLHQQADLLSPTQAVAARRGPKFMHIQEANEDQGSPWQYLYATEPAITNDPALRVAEFIPRILTNLDPYLNTQITALEHLQSAPTARLERAFAEHIDCCTNRLDAWWLGLVNVQLSLMRAATDGPDVEASDDDVARATGSYLGAFGWVEGLRPDPRDLQPVELSDELDAIFNKPGQAPLETDSQNFGYIHAPSLNHAVTAAVLRNGYLANSTPENPESLAINLTSERVRLAMGVIEGIRSGQSLSALLGYQLERGLHDRDGLFLDSIIYELRNQFPLVAKRFSNTVPEDPVPIGAVEARNVVDGLALVEHIQSQAPADQTYPFGLGAALPTVSDPAALAAINAEVVRIQDLNDAVADLAMAESVHQVVLGNYDRAAGTLDAFSKGNFPPIPEVVRTPRSGVILTHRFGLHFKSNLDPDDPVNTTPRAKGEPAINAWLADLLPPMGDIYCVVEFFNHATEATESTEVTAEDLGLLPIDLLYMVNRDAQQEMKALDERIILHVLTSASLRPDAQIRIRYRNKQPGRFSFFEVTPLLVDLRALLLRSRPLRATDSRLPNEATTSQETSASIREVKVNRVRDLLSAHNATLTTLVDDYRVLLGDPDPEVVADSAVDSIDQMIDSYIAVADPMNRFGLPGTGFGFAWDWRRREYETLIAKLTELLARWETKLSDFDQRLVDYGNLDPTTSDEQRIVFLLQAAQLISAEPTTPPTAGDPTALLDTLLNVTRPAFEAVRAALSDLPQNEGEVSRLYRALLSKQADIARHDLQALELDENKASIVAFAKTLLSKATTLSGDIAARLQAAEALLAGDPSASSEGRIDELTRAMRQLTSEDFVILPEFSISSDHAAEWQNAINGQDQLLQFLKNAAGIDFPVDDWLYGVARVREKLRHFESTTVFVEALTSSTLELVALQIPYRENDSWLAMQFPEQKPGTETPFVIDEDKVLYTAHYHTPFDASADRHCGVLVDEWTEVVPTREETTGLTFHYDRPNTEPPQTMLLALPADFTGSWQWQDLVDTLHETLDLARQRAVEPRHLDETDYARFVPAVISSVTRLPIMYALDFAYNNAVQFNQES